MVRKVNRKTIALVTGSIGVLVIALGFVIAPILSCTEIHIGYGPSLYECIDGAYSGSNPHPYFDVLMPWLLGGVLILLWAGHRYKAKKR